MGQGRVPLRGEPPPRRPRERRKRVTVRERLDINPDLTPIAMPGWVFNEMCSHALDAVPEECCGLITGRPDAPFLGLSRITNVMNKMHLSDPEQYPLDARVGYYMAETEYLSAMLQAEERGRSRREASQRNEARNASFRKKLGRSGRRPGDR